MQVSLLVELLTKLLEIPVTIWNHDRKVCEQLERMHCFWPQVQVQLTADMMELFCQSLKPHCLYELQDGLGPCMILFCAGEQVLLAGPFVAESWSDEKGRDTLAGHGLPATQLIPYKLYYCAYRVIAVMDVLHSIRVIAGSLSEDKTPYRHQLLLELPGEKKRSSPEEPVYDSEQVMQRYEAENEMIRMVQRGDTAGVLRARQRALKASEGTGLHYIAAEDIVAGMSISRTMLRKAAEGAGVHPAVVDAISREYEQKISAYKSSVQINRLRYEMTDAFCAAVRTVRKENYSPIVRRAVDYIRMHLSEPLRAEQIADDAGVGPTYLGRVFKAETGVSITFYIAEQRCRQAAELLSTTPLTVQEISGYVGYLDNNYFVKVFRAHFHMTPTEYRMRHMSSFIDP